MPGKYSHSVALADYSNRGLDYLPDDLYLDHPRSLRSPSPVNGPQTVSPISPVTPGVGPGATLSSASRSYFPHGQGSSRNTKRQSINGDMPGRRQDHARIPPPRRLVLDWEEGTHGSATNIKESQCVRSTSVQPRLSTNLRASTSFDAYTEKEVYHPQLASRVSNDDAARQTMLSKPVESASRPRNRKYQPRDDVENFQLFKDRGIPLSPALSHHGEPLLSVQEFLNASSMAREANGTSKQGQFVSSSPTSYRGRQLPQSPSLQGKGGNRSLASLKRPSIRSLRHDGGISFEGSSDEDDDVAQTTPAITTWKLSPNPTIWADESFRRRKIMDLTQELHILSTQGARKSGPEQKSRQQRTETRGRQPRIKHTTTMSDFEDSELSELDGLEIRPTQRFPSLSRRRSTDRDGTSREQEYIPTRSDGPLSPVTPHSARSFDPTVQDIHVSKAKANAPSFSYNGHSDRDYFSGTSPRKSHTPGRPYRNVGEDSRKHEPRGNGALNSSLTSGTTMMASQGYHGRSNSMSAADALGGRSQGLHTIPSQHRRQTLALRPSISTAVASDIGTRPRPGQGTSASSSAARRGSSTPAFGVPSIVRNPEKIAAINAETRRRSGAQPRTNTTSIAPSQFPGNAPSLQERQRSRHSLSLVRGRHASLSDLAGSWGRDMKSRFDARLAKERPPTEAKPNIEDAETANRTAATKAEQPQQTTSRLSRPQTSKPARIRSASLSAQSFGHSSMDPPNPRARLAPEGDHMFDLAASPPDTWTGGDFGVPAETIESHAPGRTLSLHQGMVESKIFYPDDNDIVFRRHERNNDDNDNDNDNDIDDDDILNHNAALPPPDISRYRAPSSTRLRRSLEEEEDRVMTIFRVLQDGPDPYISRRAERGKVETESQTEKGGDQPHIRPQMSMTYKTGRGSISRSSNMSGTGSGHGGRRKSFLGRIMGRRAFSGTQVDAVY
ncbi:hypothetical protein A1O1_08060 [Capronia coronata CBS 617.96]|uniref:Uncharacterized protein n=1 Tax=Capronia coronata CBS 617.96 TaxID=1182541 RepID=W9XN80_9EURO|nr:uncharacterized protein A1O1_08060 [Capronia coronata CBS 617.96]EXJ81992.1 hypothetical protein A1O1_08060 [Capronia coronata CBS 617.96]